MPVSSRVPAGRSLSANGASKACRGDVLKLPAAATVLTVNPPSASVPASLPGLAVLLKTPRLSCLIESACLKLARPLKSMEQKPSCSKRHEGKGREEAEAGTRRRRLQNT